MSDVAAAYRLVLGRDLENATVAGDHIADTRTVMEMVERIWRSPEAQRHRTAEALSQITAFHRALRPETEASGEQLDRLYELTLSAWAQRGFGSYDHWLRRGERRYADRSVKWNIDLALDDGDAEFDAIETLLASHGHDLSAKLRMGVFGSRAYRLARRSGAKLGSCTAIEIATDGLARAAYAAGQYGLTNLKPAMAADILAGGDRFDILYSVAALQYAPPPMICDLLRKMLARLDPGGWCVFQVPAYLHGYTFRTAAYLDGEGRDPAGEIHALPQRAVLDLIRGLGLDLREVVPDGAVSNLGVSYTYVATRPIDGA